MLTADLRCSKCQETGRGIYRMIGHCVNCGARPVLMLVSLTHDVLGSRRCPICQTSHLQADRPATDDEIPEA